MIFCDNAFWSEAFNTIIGDKLIHSERSFSQLKRETKQSYLQGQATW